MFCGKYCICKSKISVFRVLLPDLNTCVDDVTNRVHPPTSVADRTRQSGSAGCHATPGTDCHGGHGE